MAWPSVNPYPSRRYGVSVPTLHKKPRRHKDQYAVSRDLYTPYSQYSNKIFWKISNVVLTLRNPQYAKSIEYGVSKDLDTAYWGFLRVGTTFDIFLNIILILYLEYGVLSPLDTVYWSLNFCGLLVSADTDRLYLLDGYGVLVFRIETATYGKIWDNEDVLDLGSIETEFQDIVFNDTLTFEAALSCEPTVSSLNDNQIDFRISFDESDDEDCMPMVSYFNDLEYFNDFENEFPAIVYNDALTSKSDFLTEPTLSPQHIDEFDLKSETSLSECDEEEQNVLYFNDLFPFNVVYPNDLKSDKDNDDDKIDIEHSLGDLSVKPLSDVINTDDLVQEISTNIGGESMSVEDLEVLES
ncbi:hypothetical protein Tco_0548576 [Tanacetum coccineum]